MLQLRSHENNNIPRGDICLFIFVEQCFMFSVFDVSSISTFSCLGWGVSLLCGVSLFPPYTHKIQRSFGCTMQE